MSSQPIELSMPVCGSTPDPGLGCGWKVSTDTLARPIDGSGISYAPSALMGLLIAGRYPPSQRNVTRPAGSDLSSNVTVPVTRTCSVHPTAHTARRQMDINSGGDG